MFKKKEKEESKEKKTLIERAKEKREDAKRKYDNFQLFLAFVGAAYFVVNLIITICKNSESQYFPYLLGCTIAYIVIFVIFLLCHRKDKDQIKNDTKNFKGSIRFVKLIMNLLFIGSSLLIFIESVQNIEGSGLFAIIQTALSGLLLVLKFFSTLGKIIKTIKKKIKEKKKADKKASKEEE